MQQNSDEKQKWNKYCKSEIAGVLPMLKNLGFSVDENQIHIGGERYLMSGEKLVLIGRRLSDNRKVVIKVSSKKSGIKEIKEEHKRREVLNNLNFSYHTFFLPEEILFKKIKGYFISINLYIEEEVSFLSLSLKDQFFASLRSFKIQEGVHATTYSHTKFIKKKFGVAGDNYYIEEFLRFSETCKNYYPENKNLIKIFKRAEKFLVSNKETMNRYSGFLTHTDFVPHNFRVVKEDIYLLDFASLFFGNKYESWARFLNYMIIYNKELEQYFVKYIQENRDKEEYLSLRLMRVFKIGFLLEFYVKSLQKTSGDLKILSERRIDFWSAVLESILNNELISEKLVLEYKKSRDSLRSDVEKNRQKELRQL